MSVIDVLHVGDALNYMLQLYHRDRSAWGASHRDLGILETGVLLIGILETGSRVLLTETRSECLGCFSQGSWRYEGSYYLQVVTTWP